jgi:OmpA family
MDETDVIREVNASNAEIGSQYLRARRAADIADRSKRAATQASSAARDAQVSHQALQEERPRRRAPLPRQLGVAAGTVVLDGVACYFAAQVLNGSQDSTLVWTGLFLVGLGGGEAALDFYRDRDERAWRVVVVIISVFIALLGMLRLWFLATISDGSLVTALAGAGLFTAATAAFLCLGYRFLRAAETPATWRARRRACRARRVAKSAHATVTINGYTDSLPVAIPGGNLQLSLLRAEQVENWLIVHGVGVGRIQAFGYGDTDPVAPSTPSGQPLNRRVVVVIDPAV